MQTAAEQPSKAPVLDAQKAQKILQADLANIVKQVASGKPLSKHQRELVQNAQSPENAVVVNAQPTFVTSAAQLANCLGVSRQKLQFWKDRDGCPGRLADGRYDVRLWREWLTSKGVKLGEDLAPAFTPGRQPDYRNLLFCDGAWLAIGLLAKWVLPAVQASVVKLKPKDADRIAFSVWATVAPMIDNGSTRFGFESYFAPDAEGKPNWPEEVVTIAKRIAALSL